MLSVVAITIILVIIAGIVLFALLRSVIKAALSLVFLLFIAGLVVGFFFIQDANDFKKEFFSENSTYILEYEEELIAAFSMRDVNLSTFSPVQLSVASDIVLDEGPGKVFVLNKAVLQNTADNRVKELTGFGFEEALLSENDDVRASAFALSLVATLQEQDKMYVVKQIRNHNMVILPRTFAVKIITFDAKKYLEKIKSIIINQKDSFVDVVNESKEILNTTI